MVTERTIVLPPNPDGGPDAQYKLTVMVPKRRFLTYLLNRWWVVLVCLVLTVGFILTYETLHEGKYVSSAVLYLSGEIQLNPNTLISEESPQFFGTQIELLKSSKLQLAAYDEVGIKLVPERDPPITVDVLQPLKTSFLELRAIGPDPAVTQRFLQALVDAYLAYKKETRRSTAEDVYLSLTELVGKKASELRVEQDAWAEFQRTNNVAVLEEEAKSDGLYLADLNLQLAKLKLDRKLLEEGLSLNPKSDGWDSPFLLEALTNSSGSAFGPPDAMLKSAKVELAVRRAERDETAHQRGEVAARRLNDEVSHLEKTVAGIEAQNLEQERLELQETEKRIAAMESAIPAWEAKVLNINERLSKNLQYKNNVLREQGFYDHMLGTLGNVDLNKNVQQERLSVLQPASSALPQKRYLPLRIVLAVVIGLMLSFGIIFIWQLLDDRLVSVADVKDHFGEMLLGVVPRIRVPRRQPGAALLAPEDRRRTYVESFRRLRSALLLSASAGEQPRTLLFTSAAHGEGKTTVAANLAIVLARSGLKVVLVDADSHSVAAHPLLNSANSPGLMEYLQAELEIPAIVHPTEIAGLSFIPIGAIPAQADGTFLRPKLDTLIKRLRSEWDYVILDSPPILASDDTALMIPQADAVLLVVRPFSTRSRRVRHALELLYQRRAKVVTLVVNQVAGEDVAAQFGVNGASTVG